MSVTVKEEQGQEVLKDDVSMEDETLTKLKEKLNQKSKDAQMAAKIVSKKERSLSIGVVGSGQAGSKIAESFYKLGYDAIVLNTAHQDLKHIDLPDSNKLLLDYGIAGAAKDLSLGKSAAETFTNEILGLVNDKLGDCQVHLLTFALGGGSGAGSSEVLIELLSQTGKPLIAIVALPMDSEDAQTKHNALETLSKLTKFLQTKKLHNLIVVDNAKLEVILQDVSQLNFYSSANQKIADIFDAFNTLSSQPSSVKALDTAEFSKLLIDGEGLSVYGDFEVENYNEPEALASAIIENLDNTTLANGFDLKQTRYAGVMVAASEKTLNKLPSVAVNYAMSMVQERCSTPKGIYKGIYTVPSNRDVVKVYFMFSGLGLPTERIDQLKQEAKERMNQIKDKDVQRNLSLHLDTGVESTISEAQKIKQKIEASKSPFAKLLKGNLDRRK